MPRKVFNKSLNFFLKKFLNTHMRKQVKLFFEFGPFRLDTERGRLTRSGEIISLPPKAVSLLLVLLKHQGQVVEKETILETLWPDTVVEDSNLTQTVHLLRKALSKNGDSEPRIETLPKIGYRLITDARLVEEQDEYPGEILPAPVQEFVSTVARPSLLKPVELTSGKAEPPERPIVGKEAFSPVVFPPVATETELAETAANVTKLPASRSSMLAWFQSRNAKISVLALAGILAGIIFGLILSTPQVGTSIEKVRMVAVLPFRAPNSKNAASPFSPEIARTLTEKLNDIGGVYALPDAAISGYDKRNVSPIEAGRELYADVVITGDLENVDGRWQLRVRLQRVADGQTLMDEKFDEPSNHLAGSETLGNKIADKVTAAIEKQSGAGN